MVAGKPGSCAGRSGRSVAIGVAAVLLVGVSGMWVAPASQGASAAGRRWQPPVTPLKITRAFQPPTHDWLPGHRGVDLLSRPGQVVHSAGAGRVAYAAKLAGRGVVVVDHGTLRTTYEPVVGSVAVGQRVGKGEAIGKVTPGSGHCGSGACVHMGLKRGSTYLDPRFVLLGFRSVLRPL